MRCPIHEQGFLCSDELSPRLSILRCPEGGGAWLRPGSYWKWHERHGGDALPDASVGTEPPIQDSPAGKRCPEDGAFLIRHPVGHGLEFHIDRCGHCGGIWLDANEWEALRSHDLHDDLHLIFTSAWQARNREQRKRDATMRLLRGQLGEDDLARIVSIREWIDSHHRRHELQAFLSGEYEG